MAFILRGVRKMKRIIFGLILLFIQIALFVCGVVCHIISYNMSEISTLTEILFILGFVGLGAGIGGLLTLFSFVLIVWWIGDR